MQSFHVNLEAVTLELRPTVCRAWWINVNLVMLASTKNVSSLVITDNSLDASEAFANTGDSSLDSDRCTHRDRFEIGDTQVPAHTGILPEPVAFAVTGSDTCQS